VDGRVGRGGEIPVRRSHGQWPPYHTRLKATSHLQAYSDLEAAFEFVVDKYPGDEIVFLGSSYSGALAMKLGIEHRSGILGVLASSPASGPAMNEFEMERVISVAFPKPGIQVHPWLGVPPRRIDSTRRIHPWFVSKENWLAARNR